MNNNLKDLIVLVPDSDIEAAVRGILSRFRSLEISKPLNYEVNRHPQRDPGCFHNGPNFLNPFANQYRFSLILLDRDGSGQEQLSTIEIEQDIDLRLAQKWENRSKAIVIDPELEIWVWSDSPHVDKILGWDNQNISLQDWLIRKGYLIEGEKKPPHPKEALIKVLQHQKRPYSSSIFSAMAEQVSFNRCIDPSFIKLKDILRKWFV